MSVPPKVVSASDSRKLFRRFAARGSASDAGASPRNSSRLPRKSRRNDASSRSGEAHRGASGATPGSGGASSHAQMPDRSRSVSSMSRPRSGNGEAGSRLGASSSSRLPRMNARSVGSASHADAVDADMPSATGSGERDVWSSSSSSRVRGRSRTPVRRGSGAPETFRVTNSVFFLPRCKKTHTCSGQSQAVPERSIRRDESSQKCREERKKATTTTASARAECEARVGCRTRGGPAASSRVAGEGAPRESGGEPDRRGGGAVSRARSADFSNARRCRLAARDDRQRLLRCVRGGDAPERRRVHVGRARGCRGQPSVSGATSPPNATGRPSVLAPAGRVPSAKTLSGRIWHAPSRRSTAFVSSFFFSYFRIRRAARGTRT